MSLNVLATAHGQFLEAFRITNYLNISLFGVDVSVSNSVIWMWLAAMTAFLSFFYMARPVSIVPGRLQALAEMGYLFILNMVENNIRPEGRHYFPLLFTLFYFILFCNFLGLIPGAFTPTAQIVVTGSLAMGVFLYTVLLRFTKHGLGFFRAFVPKGTPGWLLPLMVPIELLSFLARPMTLAVRLFANMTAGHTVLSVIAVLGLAIPWALAWLPLGLSVVLMAAEVLIGFIQAYIFTILTCVYIDDAFGETEHQEVG